MNATVKSISSRHPLSLRLSLQVPKVSSATLKQNWKIVSLVTAVFLSAFAVICVADINRQAVETQQALFSQRAQLHNQWSELLSQESTVANQATVSNSAQQRLGMNLPNAHNIVMIQQ